MTHPDGTRVLAPAGAARRLTRRGFLAGAVALGGGALVAGCSDPGRSPARGGSVAPRALPTTVGPRLNVYNWAQYDDPEVIARCGREVGTTVQVDAYSSNEEMIAKLVAAKGSAGYDLVVPSATFIPQMVSNGLLVPLDKAQLPNLSNVLPSFTRLPYDNGNVYSVVKDWGTVGWLYDTTRIKRPITTWTDFIAAAQNEASGRTSILASPGEGTALYFWKDGRKLTGASRTDLEAAADFTINELAPHVRRFETAPATTLANGLFDLMQVYNGDARQGLLTVDDPERYRWGLGAPVTEYWADTWAVPAGAPNPGGAHAFINWILDPKNSYADMLYHGYNTAITGVEERAKAAGHDFPLPEMVFYPEAEIQGWEALEQDANWQRVVEIYDQAKARAAQ